MFNIILDPFSVAGNQGKHIFPDVIVDISSAHMMQAQLCEPFYLDQPRLELDMLWEPRLVQGAPRPGCCHEVALGVPGLRSHFFACVFESIQLISSLVLNLISYLDFFRELSFPSSSFTQIHVCGSIINTRVFVIILFLSLALFSPAPHSLPPTNLPS